MPQVHDLKHFLCSAGRQKVWKAGLISDPIMSRGVAALCKWMFWANNLPVTPCKKFHPPPRQPARLSLSPGSVFLIVEYICNALSANIQFGATMWYQTVPLRGCPNHTPTDSQTNVNYHQIEDQLLVVVDRDRKQGDF